MSAWVDSCEKFSYCCGDIKANPFCVVYLRNGRNLPKAGQTNGDVVIIAIITGRNNTPIGLLAFLARSEKLAVIRRTYENITHTSRSRAILRTLRRLRERHAHPHKLSDRRPRARLSGVDVQGIFRDGGD